MPLVHRPARWGANDLAALEELAAFDGPELPWSEWSLRPSAIAAAIRAVGDRERAATVELGAGPSTVVLARWARERGGTLVSVEHNPEWARAVRGLLRRERLERVAEVVDAPLHTLADPERFTTPRFDPPRAWYNSATVRGACPAGIDLLVVDGPPAGDAPRQLVRAPALPVLRDLLAPGCEIVLDDVRRPAERETAELWQRTTGGALELREELDVAVLREKDG